MMGLKKYLGEKEKGPLLTEELKEEIASEVMTRVSEEFGPERLFAPTEETKKEAVERIRHFVRVALRAREMVIEQSREEALISCIAHRMLGLGFLEQLLPPARTDLTEIALTPDGRVWVMPKGQIDFVPVDDLHPSISEVERVVDRILGAHSRALSVANPSVDAKIPRSKRLPGGARVKVLHPCVAPGDGYPAVNIRLYEPKPVKPSQIIQWGEANQEIMETLAEAVKRRLRIIVSGGTNTGKTTLLSAICNFLPREERVITVEDPQEIYVDHPHVVSLEARPPTLEGKFGYSLAQGVDDALRMSPRWLIVGEVRTGDAALSLLRAQMTDHAGISTIHADSPKGAIERLALLLRADTGMRREPAKELIHAAVDLVVHLTFDRFGVRRIQYVSQLDENLHHGDIYFDNIFVLDQEASTEEKPVWRKVGELTRTRL